MVIHFNTLSDIRARHSFFQSRLNNVYIKIILEIICARIWKQPQFNLSIVAVGGRTEEATTMDYLSSGIWDY